jgi:dihydrolipoamide dehydrogenase
VIATGSRPIEHDLLRFTKDVIWTPQQAVHVPEIPKSLLVIGSDYLAVELASVYAALGGEVTIADAAERILAVADADLVRPLDKRLGDRFKSVAMGVRIKSAKIDKSGVKVSFEGDGAPSAVKFDRAIVAIGSLGNTADLGLAHTGAHADEPGFIAVDEQLRTNDPRIFAVGDVTGTPLLADRAIRQGRICGEVLAGWGSVYDARAVPMTVFTDPQVAWCGLTEQDANALGVAHQVAKTPWGASGRAVGMGRSEGLTKIIFEPDTQLVLGIGMCGPHACEMIGEGALAIEMGATLTDLAATIHPHPTMNEMIADAAKQAGG